MFFKVIAFQVMMAPGLYGAPPVYTVYDADISKAMFTSFEECQAYAMNIKQIHLAKHENFWTACATFHPDFGQ